MKKLIGFLVLVLFFSLTCERSRQIEDDVIIYPNPAKTFFYIESEKYILPPYIKIYNDHKRLVYSAFIGKDLQIVRVDVNLPPGQYMVVLDSDK